MRKLIFLLLVITLLAAACSSGGAIAATVNGTDISVAEVEALRPDTATVARQDFADDLFRLIIEEVVRQGGQDIGAVEDQAAIDTIYAEYVSGLETQGPLEEVLEASGATTETLRHDAFQQAYFPAVQAKILEQEDAAIRAAYEELSVAEKSEVCARHILVASQEEAQQVVDRIAAGEEFAVLATELSLDTGSGAAGGDLGCAPAGRYVPPFAEATLSATIGEVVDPVESDFGFHVIIVDSREELAFEALRDQLGSSLINDWFLDRMGSADVVIDEKYGTWQTDPEFGVTAPA